MPVTKNSPIYIAKNFQPAPTRFDFQKLVFNGKVRLGDAVFINLEPEPYAVYVKGNDAWGIQISDISKLKELSSQVQDPKSSNRLPKEYNEIALNALKHDPIIMEKGIGITDAPNVTLTQTDMKEKLTDIKHEVQGTNKSPSNEITIYLAKESRIASTYDELVKLVTNNKIRVENTIFISLEPKPYAAYVTGKEVTAIQISDISKLKEFCQVQNPKEDKLMPPKLLVPKENNEMILTCLDISELKQEKGMKLK